MYASKHALNLCFIGFFSLADKRPYALRADFGLPLYTFATKYLNADLPEIKYKFKHKEK